MNEIILNIKFEWIKKIVIIGDVKIPILVHVHLYFEIQFIIHVSWELFKKKISDDLPPLPLTRTFLTRRDVSMCRRRDIGLVSWGVWRQPGHTEFGEVRGSRLQSNSFVRTCRWWEKWLQAGLCYHWSHLHIMKMPTRQVLLF